MGTKIFEGKSTSTHTTTDKNPDEGFRLSGHTETEDPKHGRTTTLPRDLTWYAVQAVKLNPGTKTVLLRSFPFFALSMKHARDEILGLMDKEGCPYTHIFQYATLRQLSGKLTKAARKADSINIKTGKKL